MFPKSSDDSHKSSCNLSISVSVSHLATYEDLLMICLFDWQIFTEISQESSDSVSRIHKSKKLLVLELLDPTQGDSMLSKRRYLAVDTAQLLRRIVSLSLPLWKPQISLAVSCYFRRWKYNSRKSHFNPLRHQAPRSKTLYSSHRTYLCISNYFHN
jgi:hypothetical protein